MSTEYLITEQQNCSTTNDRNETISTPTKEQTAET